MSEEFFDEIMEQSEVKSEIVSKYFGAWTTIMNVHARNRKLAYIDLFSGPGRYEDGTKSTPLKVTETIINNKDLRRKMVTIFNDANPDFASNLEEEINNLKDVNSLEYKPIVYNSVIGEEIAEMFENMSMVPTLAFVDPWGYKGLSSKLIGALIKDWGSDCIFFFNYNRINMGLSNKIVKKHMDAIFGEDRADELRERVIDMSPEERELTILNELAESLSNGRKNYVLPFRFIREDGTRTSHYLILVSKHVLGYTLMKQIMWRYSSEHEDGVASFSYIPVSVNYKQLSLLSLYDRPLDTLGEDLLQKFSGRTLDVEQIHDRHQVGTPFIMANYQEALRRLEEKGQISTDPPAVERMMRKGKRTFAKHVKVTFP
jgi:three-Cys-motif partner protein